MSRRIVKGHRKGTTDKFVVAKETRHGIEIWRVSADGRIKEIRTTASSRRAIDEAVKIYGPALERLANR